MPCCWAGDNGDFNNYEMARAWVVYSTVTLLSPISLYVVHSFYVTRNNWEMKVREPYAVILCSFTMWVSFILESIYHLSLDLELAKRDWNDFIVIRPESTSEIFDTLAYAGFVLAGSMYLFRVWMFWYKSGLSGEIHGFGEAIAAQTLRERPKLTNYYTNRRRRFGNRRLVIAACLLWSIMAIAPVVVLDFMLNVDRRLLKHIISAAVVIPVPCVMSYLLRNVKNKFGIVSESKLAFLILLIIIAFNLLLYFTGMRNSYYRWLIDYWLKSVLICGYFLWLMRFIQTFSVDKINDRDDTKSVRDGLKSAICCDRPWVLSIPSQSVSYEDYQLHELLESKKGFDLFRTHLGETLCAENLLFFVDVYMHRKTLDVDPYLKLTEDEAEVFKACARVEMKWVDQDSLETPSMIPTCTDIYKLYIQPLSQMEVNISGRMRKNIVRIFERKNKKKMNLRKRLSFATRLSFASPALPQRRAASLEEVELTPKAKKRSGDCKSMEAPLTAGPRKSTKRFIRSHSAYSTDEVVDIRVEPVASGNLPGDIPPHFTTMINFGQTEPSIEHLYPAWKTLVNLLKNDSLVRFKIENSRKPG